MWCSIVREGGAELGRGLGLPGGEQRGEDPVVDLGVEDGEGQAVGGQVVGVGVRAPGDQPVAAQPGQVVGGLGHGVGGAEQSGHQGAQAPVGDAGDGAQGDAQGAGQGLDPRVAKSHGCSSPPVRIHGRVRDPLEDWIRKDAGLAGTFSLQQPGVDRTRPGLKLIEVMQAPLAAQVAGRVDDGLHPQGAAVFQVLLDAGVLVEGVDGDLGAAGDDLGLELALRCWTGPAGRR